MSALPKDPTAELLAAMAHHDLRPGVIVWDGEVHRFPGVGRDDRDDAGWYRAFPDMKGAVFGCHRTDLETSWQMEGGLDQMSAKDRKAFLAEVERQRKEREKDRRRAANAARKRALRLLQEAEDATPEHPYLKAKGVTSIPPGSTLKVDEQGKLLIPMMSLKKGDDEQPILLSLQRIWPDGVKRFLPGGWVRDTRTTIGAARLKRDEKGVVPSQRIYVTEGWVTGWSISECADTAVLVCFMVNNLEGVATWAKEAYPDLEVVIAADNDRWTEGNPGVTEARRVATKIGVGVAIPDFSPEHVGPEKGPTDFNDLHQLEGPEAVLRWLDPERAAEAVTEPPEPEPGSEPAPEPEPEPEPERPVNTDPVPPPPPPPPPEEPSGWLRRAPFRVLGQCRGTFYFMGPTGEIVDLTASQLGRREQLFRLANLSWWAQEFPANNGVSWVTAVDALIQVSHSLPIYYPERRRGRGCWVEEGPDGEDGVVLHLGDRMIAPGHTKWISPEDYESPGGWVYERQPPLKGPSPKARASVEEAREVLELFRDLLWADEASGDLLAGWTLLAPVCGALRWRPHVWVVGERGSGKSTVIERLVLPLLGDLLVPAVGGSTEAGIRQEIRSDALPVVFDEAEEGEGVGSRIQRVLELARQASSETQAKTLKGTTHGAALQFRVRSMFCLASIGGAVYHEADRSRVSLLQMKGPSQVPPEERREHWERYRPRLDKVRGDVGARIISRTLHLLRSGVLLETVERFRRAGGAVLPDQRAGDQYGTLHAGAWCLAHDDPPSDIEAREMLGSHDLSTYQEEHQPEGVKALGILCQQRERVETSNGVRTMSVGELIHVAAGHHGVVGEDEANRVLGQCGLRVEPGAGGGYVLLVANSSEWIRRALDGTPYSRGMRTVLRSLEGVEAVGNVVRFPGGRRARATSVPLRYVYGEED